MSAALVTAAVTSEAIPATVDTALSISATVATSPIFSEMIYIGSI